MTETLTRGQELLAKEEAEQANLWEKLGLREAELAKVHQEPLPVWPTVDQCTQVANAHRIIHHYRDRIRYVPGIGWLIWNGKYWMTDQTKDNSKVIGFIRGLSKHISREVSILAQQASVEIDNDRRRELMKQSEERQKWAVKTENFGTLESSLALAKIDLLLNYADLNPDPYLFNVQNGTLDLRTGELRPHDPADLITHISPVAFDPSATCPTWERFLSEVFSGDADMIEFLRRAMGWTLTGVVEERALFFLYGEHGHNGKTTVVETILNLMGDHGEDAHGYGRKVTVETFMRSKREEDNDRKAATLAGPRYVFGSEVDNVGRLNEQLIKDITGGDTLEARKLYHERFTFKPLCKVWLYGNYKPEIQDDSNAMWSRPKIVHFGECFEGREDSKLRSKIDEELPGVLNWTLRGCLDWQRGGLQPPDKVRAATQDYREEMDVFGPFIAECCVLHPRAEVWAADLMTAYLDWCQRNDEIPQNRTKFGMYLNRKGTKPDSTSGRVKRIGIGLRTRE